MNIKLLLLLVFSIVFSNGYPQVSTLENYIDIVKHETLNNIVTTSSIRANTVQNYEASVLRPLMDVYLSTKTEDNKSKSVKFFLEKHKAKIYDYLDRIYSFGDMPPLIYHIIPDDYDRITNIPFGFAKNNNSLVFYQSGIFYDKVLNTFNQSSDERASRITKEILLPSLENFKNLLTVSEIRYFALIAGYMVQDFSSKDLEDGETVSILISRDTLLKYLNAQITAEQVFSLSQFYNSNKNNLGSVRRVLVK